MRSSPISWRSWRSRKARSFTRAAAQLGVSQSALSQTIRTLETRLGLRLLNRTTRSVSPTEAGEYLVRNVGPRFEEIEAELTVLNSMRGKPAGSIRLTADEPAARGTLWPVLNRFLAGYPDIKISEPTPALGGLRPVGRCVTLQRQTDGPETLTSAIPNAFSRHLVMLNSSRLLEARGRPE